MLPVGSGNMIFRGCRCSLPRGSGIFVTGFWNSAKRNFIAWWRVQDILEGPLRAIRAHLTGAPPCRSFVRSAALSGCSPRVNPAHRTNPPCGRAMAGQAPRGSAPRRPFRRHDETWPASAHTGRSRCAQCASRHRRAAGAAVRPRARRGRARKDICRAPPAHRCPTT